MSTVVKQFLPHLNVGKHACLYGVYMVQGLFVAIRLLLLASSHEQ